MTAKKSFLTNHRGFIRKEKRRGENGKSRKPKAERKKSAKNLNSREKVSRGDLDKEKENIRKQRKAFVKKKGRKMPLSKGGRSTPRGEMVEKKNFHQQKRELQKEKKTPPSLL